MSSIMISVLMTAYNREKYIGEAIESVLASTYTNFELIIVDDCSNDNTVKIARSYEAKDSRVKVYVNERNLGDYLNRNKAASYAKGKYLKYVDADDMIYPFGLEQLVYYMEKFPDAGYGLSSQEQDVSRIYPVQLTPSESYFRHYFEQPVFHKAPLSAIFRKNVFDKIGGFTGKRFIGDFELWHILSTQYPVVLMPHGIVWYRVHEEQEMQIIRKSFLIPFKYLVLSIEMLTNSQCPLKETDQKHALRKVYRTQARYILSVGKNYSLKSMHQLKKKTKFSYFQLLKLAFYKTY